MVVLGPAESPFRCPHTVYRWWEDENGYSNAADRYFCFHRTVTLSYVCV